MLDFDDLLNKIPRKQDFSTIRSSQQIYVDKTAIIYKIIPRILRDYKKITS